MCVCVCVCVNISVIRAKNTSINRLVEAKARQNRKESCTRMRRHAKLLFPKISHLDLVCTFLHMLLNYYDISHRHSSLCLAKTWKLTWDSLLQVLAIETRPNLLNCRSRAILYLNDVRKMDNEKVYDPRVLKNEIISVYRWEEIRFFFFFLFSFFIHCSRSSYFSFLIRFEKWRWYSRAM